MNGDRPPQELREYERAVQNGATKAERFFAIFLAVTLLIYGAAGYYLHTIKPASKSAVARRDGFVKTTFVMPPPRPEPKPAPAPEPKPAVKAEEKKPAPEPAKKEEPIDLSDKPELGKNEDDIQKPGKAPKVRRVYGLRKVYSKGIGAGDDLSDAVIGKYGNTINASVDTLSATGEELKGSIASITTVETMPVMRKRPSPKYNQEMLENKIEGVVKVKVLVDIDGKVKKAIALNDLGFGAAALAREVCLDAHFDPATADGQPRAVWITIPVRFTILG